MLTLFLLRCSHSQMNTRIFEAFTEREKQVTEYMAGCGMQYGGECTCGPDCRCKNCPTHSNVESMHDPSADMDMGLVRDPYGQEGPLQVEQPMQLFGMGPPATVPPSTHAAMNPVSLYGSAAQHQYSPSQADSKLSGRTQRNPSILSYGNRGSLRGMSITSETTFGRAMSGLSALSIDWENLDDFDLEVDHSAHIGNSPGAAAAASAGGGQEHRSSIRRSILSAGSSDGAHVSFKV